MNWSNIRAIAFDLDDTLVDRHQLLEDWLKGGFRLDDVEDVHVLDRRGYGPRRPVFRTIARRSGTRATEVARRFQSEMPRYARPVGDAIAVLGHLGASFPLAVATNGTSQMQRGKLAAAGLAGYFAATVISGEVGVAKPSPHFFTELAAQLSCPPSSILMVGDHPINDMQGAARAGLRTCWLRGGLELGQIPVDCRILRLGDLLTP